MKNFLERYFDSLNVTSLIVWEAKFFIVENYGKITDWGNLTISVTNGCTEFCPNKKETGTYVSRSWKESNFFKSLHEDDNSLFPIVDTITDVILDEIDGDLSLTINGEEWWWIDDDTTISIAQYIEMNMSNN